MDITKGYKENRIALGDRFHHLKSNKVYTCLRLTSECDGYFELKERAHLVGSDGKSELDIRTDLMILDPSPSREPHPNAFRFISSCDKRRARMNWRTDHLAKLEGLMAKLGKAMPHIRHGRWGSVKADLETVRGAIDHILQSQAMEEADD